MGKIRERFQGRSIKTAYIWSVLGCVFSALILALALSALCQHQQTRLCERYEAEYRELALEEPGKGMAIGFEQLDEAYDVRLFYYDPMAYFTPEDKLIYNMWGILSIAVYPVCFAFCMAVSSVLFYRRQLQAPFAMLNDAAGRIAENNLDFRVVYERENELGRLCASFEKMRLALQENNEEMWRRMEERRRLNAAFSHDLRTPLTVLKGQGELLARYAPKMTPKKLQGTAEMMCRHIARLEAYVKTMGDLQRLEDIEIRRRPLPAGELSEQLAAAGEMLCGERRFDCRLLSGEEILVCVDGEAVQQVYENLLSNAARFAREKISVFIRSENGYLYVTVADDGEGFTEAELEQATRPFYKTEMKTGEEHFGMGLNICKILCEKHGGYIRLENRGGARVTAAFRQGAAPA